MAAALSGAGLALLGSTPFKNALEQAALGWPLVDMTESCPEFWGHGLRCFLSELFEKVASGLLRGIFW